MRLRSGLEVTRQVCRGKVSEGINFKYDNARAVFLIGIPYPPLLDPKVREGTPHRNQAATVTSGANRAGSAMRPSASIVAFTSCSS